ncbi:MAG: hypothetical protein ACRDZ4_00905 [Egibacteraceae bacterium]
MRGTLDAHGPTVSRLAMIDVTWAYCRFVPRERPEKQVWNQYRSLLTGLLGLDENDPDSAAGAWICQIKEGQPTGEWRKGVDAEQVVERLANGLRQCGKNSTRAWMEHQEKALAAQMNLSACRLYLTPARAAATLAEEADSCTPTVPAHVCIDFPFKEHHHRYWLYATLSIWTHKPSSLELAPCLPADDPAEKRWDLQKLHEHYDGKLGEEFEKRVQDHFHLAEMEILNREYRPPQFWLMQDPPADDLDTDDLNACVRVLLDTPDVRNTGIAVAVMAAKKATATKTTANGMSGQMLTLRRFVPGDRGELPCYVVIPLGEGAVQEEDAWLLAQGLTDLEASTAAQLFEAATDLDVYGSHLKVYKAVAAQADVFWDQLALHLPVARGSRVHKLIELVHQTLLQGIADLDQAAILTNEALRRVERSATDLTDQFDRTFTERELPDERSIRYRQSIRSSLTDTGYIDDATREANRVVKNAEQVQRSYITLLEGIAHAFDERRVRGTDVLDNVGFALAVLVVVFSFFPEALNAIFANEGFPYHTLVLLSIGGAVSLLLAGLFVLLRRLQLSTLGTKRFRKSHEQLREFLADCATDRLTRLRAAGWKRVQETLDHPSMDERRAWDRFIDEWNKRDYTLARQCARLLDELAHDKIYDNYYKSIWNLSPSLKDLARQVERWASKILLVSERPREFWEFALPRLTFLYRFYPMMDSELGSNSLEATESAIVSGSDFRFTVVNQCGGRPEKIDMIKCWARHQIEQSRRKWGPATDFVKALNEVGLKAGMTREDFEAMLTKMGVQLPAPPRSVADSPRIVGTGAHFDHDTTLDE